MFVPASGQSYKGHSNKGYHPKIGLWQKSLTWNSQPIEILLAALSLTRIYLMAPWDSFQFSPSLYRLFQVLPQPLWGLLGVVLGSALLWHNLRDEHNQRLTARRRWAIAMMLQYVVYATLFGLSNPYSLAWLDRGILAWAALWCVANLSFRIIWQKRAISAWENENEVASVEAAKEGEANVNGQSL